MKKKLKIILQITFSISLGCFFIWFFIRQLSTEEIKELWNAFKRAEYRWLIVACIIGIASHWMRAIRSFLLLEPMGYKPKQWNVFSSVIIGYLANLAIPRLGEVLRCSILTQYEKIPISKSLGTVITERVIDMIIYILLFVLVLLFLSNKLYQYAEMTFLTSFLQKVSLLWIAGIAIGIIVALALIYFFVLRKQILHYAVIQKVELFIKGIWIGLKSILKLKRPFLFIVETLLIWLLYFFGFYVCLYSLPETVNLPLSASIAAMAFATIGGIIVQGGIGLYPLLVAGTLAVYGVSEPVGYALGWLAWGAQQVVVILIGCFSLIFLPYYNNKKNGKIRDNQIKNS